MESRRKIVNSSEFLKILEEEIFKGSPFVVISPRRHKGIIRIRETGDGKSKVGKFLGSWHRSDAEGGRHLAINAFPLSACLDGILLAFLRGAHRLTSEQLA